MGLIQRAHTESEKCMQGLAYAFALYGDSGFLVGGLNTCIV